MESLKYQHASERTACRLEQAPRHACILEVQALNGPQHGSGTEMLGSRSCGKLRPSGERADG